MKYQVVESYYFESRRDFEKEVNKRIAEGWEPIGGIAVSSYRESYRESYGGNKEDFIVDHFYQAMIKKDE